MAPSSPHRALRATTSAAFTGLVGALAYQAVRAVAVRLPVHDAAVATTAVALRGLRRAEEGAEAARLRVADVVAEARERIGEETPPPSATDVAHDHDH